MLFAILIPSAISGLFPVALAQEDPTFETGQSFYMLGDNVEFVGGGYSMGAQYVIAVGGDEIGPFSGTGEGGIPPEMVWDTSGQPTGTYEAVVNDVTDPENPQFVDSARFGLWGTNKEEYLYPDDVPVTISGGGIFPEAPFFIDIAYDSTSLVDYPCETFADAEGEFSHEWVFDEMTADGMYTITVSGTGTYDSEAETFELVTTIVLFVTVEARAEYVLGEIEDKQDEIMGYVEEEEMRITDIEGALIAKLRNTAKKIEQAIGWLGTSKDKVARNMLKAAWNKLKAFINQVRAQTGKHIEAGVAGELIEQAETLQRLIQGMRDGLAPSPSSEDSGTQLSFGNGNNGNGKAKGHWKHSWKGNGKGKGKGKGKPF